MGTNLIAVPCLSSSAFLMLLNLSTQWDPSGEQLAMLPNGNTFVYIWSAISKELQKIDTDFKVGLGSLGSGKAGGCRMAAQARLSLLTCGLAGAEGALMGKVIC